MSASASGLGAGTGDVADVRKYYQRLKEMFREKINFYRDIVYQLTGFFITLKYEATVSIISFQKWGCGYEWFVEDGGV